MSKITAAIIGFALGGGASTFQGWYMVTWGQRAEKYADEKSMLRKIREDVGGIYTLINITNGLLGAILATLLV
jgi:hypothetical protein